MIMFMFLSSFCNSASNFHQQQLAIFQCKATSIYIHIYGKVFFLCFSDLNSCSYIQLWALKPFKLYIRAFNDDFIDGYTKTIYKVIPLKICMSIIQGEILLINVLLYWGECPKTLVNSLFFFSINCVSLLAWASYYEALHDFWYLIFQANVSLWWNIRNLT